VQDNKATMKAVGIDSWTGGAKFYGALYTALKDKNISLKLLHLGSWGTDKGAPVFGSEGELPVIDVSYYKGMSISEILMSEKPDIVVFLSTDTFAHRAINRYCMFHDIPTVHLYHGIMNALPQNVVRGYKVKIVSQLKFVMSRVMKMLLKVWPLYIDSLVTTDAKLSDWIRFLKDNIDLALARKLIVSAPDSKATNCCIFTSADKSHAESKYGYDNSEIKIVGNPDLPKFGFSESHLGRGLKADRSPSNELFYIDTALIFRGAVFATKDEFLAHLIEVRDAAESLSLVLVIKLHPQHFRTSLPDELESNGIGVIRGDDFADRLANSKAAIVETSSAALLPALCGIPVFLAKFGKLHDQKFGDLFETYPRKFDLVELHDLSESLNSCDFVDCKVKCQDWIIENAGPIPFSKMPQRVAEVVYSLALKKHLDSII